jgi:hypothetical protein
MSWDIFKKNILQYANNPDSIKDIDTVANLYATEYDAAIKRGSDILNKASVKKGNVEAMKSLFKAAFLKGQSSNVPFDLVGEMGKGVLAYWSGTTLNEFPIPIVPAPGSIQNISVVSNIVTISGQWTPAVMSPPIPNDEAEVIKRDIEIEYPANQQVYEEQFETEEAAMENNSDVEAADAISRFEEYKADVIAGEESEEEEPADPNKSITSGGSSTTQPVQTKGTKKGKGGNQALFNRCGNGVWPAKGEENNWEVSSTEGAGTKCPRYWYKVNPEYLKKNCTEIIFPTANGSSKICVHKDLAAVVKPAIDKIKAAGLTKYIKNCAGGLAVRNVTCGTRFSNHAWGTAIDMNTEIYPYGYKFKDDGVYNGSTKVRDLNEFDKGFQQVAAIFKSQGMTWLSNNDPMHVSIYE